MFPEGRSSPSCLSRDFPLPQSVLEEIVADIPLNRGASLAFALMRCRGDAPVMIILPRAARLEFGRPGMHGIRALLPSTPLLLVAPHTFPEALWAMEQALKSGAIGGAVGIIDGVSLTQTRRLDFAARDGDTPALLLCAQGGGLSAARRRWRLASLPRVVDSRDVTAQGAVRLHAELVRTRDGQPGAWDVDHDPATGRLTMAAALAAERPRKIAERAA